MKIREYLVLLFLPFGFFMQSQELKAHRWENRVIVLVHGKEATKSFHKQLKALVSDEKAMDDRDLILLVLNDSSVVFPNSDAPQYNATQLRKDLKIDGAFEGIILIGKDGGVKMREEFYIAPQKIFDLIDAMPLRQAEMKN